MLLLVGMTIPGCTLVYDLSAPLLDARVLDVNGIAPPGGAPLTLPTATAAEVCNGRDDDGDGLIDEGYADTDADGIADCADAACLDLEVAPAGSLAVSPACSGGPTEPVTDPWAHALAWEWTTADAASGADAGLSTPIVGQLDDDNGDGMIDALDEPEIILQTASGDPSCGGCEKGGQVIALDGRTGREKWRYAAGGSDAGVLLADIDGDQRGDIVAHNDRGELVALDGGGQESWRAPDLAYGGRIRPPIVADLDGDGSVALIDGAAVFSGASGELRYQLSERWPSAAGVAAVADADLDGHAEIYFQGVAFGTGGAPRWIADIQGAGGAWPVVVQADEDPEGEIAWIARDYTLWDDDGTLLHRQADPVITAPGAPCAGDLDDDGQVELVWADGTSLQAMDLDGSLLWRVTVGSANQAGCTTFDVDGDHAAEVLYADNGSMLVLDGRTGARLMEDAGLSIAPGAYPTVADIDNDTHADIIVAGHAAAGKSAVRVYRHAGNGWASAGNTWPTYDYTVSNVLADGAVPRHPGPYWTEYQTYRGRPAGDLVSRPDLLVAITDVCVSRCPDGTATISLQVGNQGGRDQYAGGTVVVYAAADHREVGRVELPAIPHGYALGGSTLTVPAAALGRGGLVAQIEDEGIDADFLPDCDVSNEIARWVEPVCP